MQNSQDDRITQHVKNKLAMRGFGSDSHLAVQSSNGMVTLSGTVPYAHQKKAAVSAITGMAGIERVIDQMTVKPAVKRQDLEKYTSSNHRMELKSGAKQAYP